MAPIQCDFQRSISYGRGLYACQVLNSWGIPTVNTARVAATCGDKLVTSAALQAAWRPSAQCARRVHAGVALEAIEEMGYPVVLKPVIGSWGRSATKANDGPARRTGRRHRARRPAGSQRRLPPRAHAVPLPRRRAARAGAPDATRRVARRRPHGDASRARRPRHRRARARLALRARAGPDGTDDGLGFNTAILVAPDGELVGPHPQDCTSRSRPATTRTSTSARARPTRRLPGPRPRRTRRARSGMPTCWDEWFPEVARAYSPRAAPRCWSTRPRSAPSPTTPTSTPSRCGSRSSSATASPTALFMVVPNRCGAEGADTFYGSSFISDPYGRVLVQAPRDEAAVLVADLDLDQRRDWLDAVPVPGDPPPRHLRAR